MISGLSQVRSHPSWSRGEEGYYRSNRTFIQHPRLTTSPGHGPYSATSVLDRCHIDVLLCRSRANIDWKELNWYILVGATKNHFDDTICSKTPDVYPTLRVTVLIGACNRPIVLQSVMICRNSCTLTSN